MIVQLTLAIDDFHEPDRLLLTAAHIAGMRHALVHMGPPHCVVCVGAFPDVPWPSAFGRVNLTDIEGLL